MRRARNLAGNVALFQLHAADAVQEAPLPRYSRIEVLDNGQSFFYLGFESLHAQQPRACEV